MKIKVTKYNFFLEKTTYENLLTIHFMNCFAGVTVLINCNFSTALLVCICKY